jgi:hypothetical protein
MIIPNLLRLSPKKIFSDKPVMGTIVGQKYLVDNNCFLLNLLNHQLLAMFLKTVLYEWNDRIRRIILRSEKVRLKIAN